MPPKKDAPADGAGQLIAGFENKEVKLIAAAFLSSTAPDKYDYDLMASLTGNTAGSLKKMWPPIKKKAIDAHPSFATFLGNSGTNIASGESKVTAPKATSKAKGGGRKRKADAEVNGENETKSAEAKSATLEKSDSAGGKSTSKKAAPAKKPAKRAKKEVKQEVKSEEDSADGGDGLDAAEENAEV